MKGKREYSLFSLLDLKCIRERMILIVRYFVNMKSICYICYFPFRSESESEISESVRPLSLKPQSEAEAIASPAALSEIAWHQRKPPISFSGARIGENRDQIRRSTKCLSLGNRDWLEHSEPANTSWWSLFIHSSRCLNRGPGGRCSYQSSYTIPCHS